MSEVVDKIASAALPMKGAVAVVEQIIELCGDTEFVLLGEASQCPLSRKIPWKLQNKE